VQDEQGLGRVQLNPSHIQIYMLTAGNRTELGLDGFVQVLFIHLHQASRPVEVARYGAVEQSTQIVMGGGVPLFCTTHPCSPGL